MKTENQANTVSAAQIEEWKKRYGKVWSATTTNEQGEEETAYFKPIDRTTMSYAISLESQHKTFEVAEHVLQNCWIGGCEKFKTEIPYIMGAIEIVQSVMYTKSVKVKNV